MGFLCTKKTGRQCVLIIRLIKIQISVNPPASPLDLSAAIVLQFPEVHSAFSFCKLLSGL